jgi:ribonuclease HI
LSDKETLIIYTDGSVASNNSGGVGIRIISIAIDGEEIIDNIYRAGFPNANSGQMEIIACTTALEEAARLQLNLSIKKVVIFTDSKYVFENYKTAMFEWSANKWLKKTGAPVQDAHLWKDLNKQIKKYTDEGIYVEIKWVKGHREDKHNRAVDSMAKKASQLPPDKVSKIGPISISQPRKVIPSRKVEIGCVQMRGQKISIRILSGKFLRPQNLWCYQYEVISDNSPFLGLADQIFSDISLTTNKSYYVKFNSLEKNPRIEKLYWEIHNEYQVSGE